MEITPSFPKFLDLSNPVYRDLHGTCDTVYRELHGQGIGTTVKCTATFTLEEEEKLWATGAISILNPKALQLAVFMLGVHE